ncbi:MAG: LemA family protein [Patescibacteria group bacterium]|nr:LemA family protein [Patescibacteria group bacterium]
MIIYWVVAAVIAIILIWVVAVFNSLIVKNNRVKNAWADVDVQLKRRYDLVPNLVETVKGYKDYEASVLESVTQTRTSAISAQNGGIAARSQAENAFSGALKNLFAVAENYPQLRASENFQKLQDELTSLEDDIQSARRYYNAAAREMDNAIQVFPANIVAGAFGFKQPEFFGVEENEENPVKVSF